MNSKTTALAIFPKIDINLFDIFCYVRICRDGKYYLTPVRTFIEPHQEEDHMAGRYEMVDPELAIRPDGVKRHITACYLTMLKYKVRNIQDENRMPVDFVDENQEDENKRNLF